MKNYKYLLLIIVISSGILLEGLNNDKTWHLQTDFIKLEEFYKPIMDDPDIKNIMIYPYHLMNNEWGFPQLYQLIGQIFHNKNIANGISPISTKKNREYQSNIRDIDNKIAIDTLVENNIDTILVYRNFIDNFNNFHQALIRDNRIIYSGHYVDVTDMTYPSANFKSRNIDVYKIIYKKLNKNFESPFLIEDQPFFSYIRISPYKYCIHIDGDIPDKDNLQITFNAPYSPNWILFDRSDYYGADILNYFNKNNLELHRMHSDEPCNKWNLNINELCKTNSGYEIILFYRPYALFLIDKAFIMFWMVLLISLYIFEIISLKRKHNTYELVEE